MSAGRWKLARERVGEVGRTVKLYAREFTPEGQPRQFRRVLERSRAGVGKAGGAWCAAEICERAEDGTLSPWRPEPWEHRRE